MKKRKSAGKTTMQPNNRRKTQRGEGYSDSTTTFRVAKAHATPPLCLQSEDEDLVLVRSSFLPHAVKPKERVGYQTPNKAAPAVLALHTEAKGTEDALRWVGKKAQGAR